MAVPPEPIPPHPAEDHAMNIHLPPAAPRICCDGASGAISGGGSPDMPLMSAAFCTAVSDGSEGKYELRFGFPTLAALQAAHREWLGRSK